MWSDTKDIVEGSANILHELKNAPDSVFCFISFLLFLIFGYMFAHLYKDYRQEKEADRLFKDIRRLMDKNIEALGAVVHAIEQLKKETNS